MRTRICTAALGLVFLLLATATAAFGAGYATDDRGRLYEVLPRKQEAKYLGWVKVKQGATTYTPSLTDIALSAKHGMYGITFTELFKIDMADPAKSKRIGSLGGVSLNALAFDEDDNLWATGGSSLYRIDIVSGRAKLVGSFGVGTSDGDLAFVDKTLYATLQALRGTYLAQIDPKTGKATAVARIRTGDKRSVYSVWGLIWTGQKMFALTSTGGVYELDLKTGVATRLFTASSRFWGACPMLRL